MIGSAILEQHGERLLFRSPEVRRLGSLFQPLRRSYLLFLPSFLIFCAVLTWLVVSDFTLLLISVAMTLVAAYVMFDILARRAPLRISHLLAMTLGLGYGLGTANTWLTLPRSGEALASFMGLDPGDVNIVMAAMAVSLALMLCLGEAMERPVFGEDFRLRFNNRSVMVLTLCTTLLIAAFAKGSVGFMGASVDATGAAAGKVSILGALAVWLAGPLLAMSVCICLNSKQRWMRLYCTALTIVIVILIVPLGRRTLIYSVVLAFIGLRLGEYKVPWSPLKKVVSLGLLAIVVYFATIAFFYLRLAGYQSQTKGLGQRVAAAWEYYQTTDYSEVKNQFSQNVQKRTFIVGFLAKLRTDVGTMSTAHGQDFLSQAAVTVPSALNSNKNSFFNEEGLANELFGEHFTDEANSVLTAGMIDFGMLGLILYPLLFAFIFRKFTELMSKTFPNFVACFIALAVISSLLEPETTITGYFTGMRDSILFGLMIWFFVSLPEFRWKRGVSA